MQKKFLSMFLVMLFLSIPAGAMFKPSAMMRYVNSFKWLKSQNTKNFFQVGIGGKNLPKANVFAKNNNFNFSTKNFNPKFDWRWSLPFFITGYFLEFNLDDFVARLESDNFIFDKYAKKALQDDDGRRAVIDYVLKNPSKVIESQQKLELLSNLIKQHPEFSSQLVSFAIGNFNSLLETRYGQYCLRLMSDYDIQIAQAFCQSILDNIKFLNINALLCVTLDLVSIGFNFSLYCGKNFEISMSELLCKNFVELIKTNEGQFLAYHRSYAINISSLQQVVLEVAGLWVL